MVQSRKRGSKHCCCEKPLIERIIGAITEALGWSALAKLAQLIEQLL